MKKIKLSKIKHFNKKEMSELKFEITNFEKYGTKRVEIFFANLKLDKDCEILEVNDTNYNFKRVTVKLSPEKAHIIKEFEEEVNNYLEKKDIPEVVILYGNRIYPKMKRRFSAENLKNIKLRGVYVNEENKSFPQLWLE